ncbi:MAG: sensor histidine kinase, partial [Pseudonocardiaceae bacterium]|nr:sensor histidine kinase [Pseudonocardiaceae bacterium]
MQHLVLTRRRRVQALAAAAALFAALVAVDLVSPRGHLLDATGALWFVGWLVAALVAGEVARGRADYLAEVERRAIEA